MQGLRTEKQVKKPLDYVLVKPAGSRCDLRCRYCYYFPKNRVGLMSDRILHRLIKDVCGGRPDQIAFGWQGGEPLLAGIDFYKKAVEYQLRYGGGKRIGNAFQTNGLAIDGRWIEFFARYSFLVGLSIDGPRDIHDEYRIDPEGRGSHERVENSLTALLDGGVAVNSLSVVTSRAAGRAGEIYSYLKERGLRHLQFIPCLEFGPDGRIADYSVSPEAYGRFLCRLFDLWWEDWTGGEEVHVRLFDNLLQIYCGGEADECAFREECGTYLVVEHDGSVFSCDFFVEDRRLLGNIERDEPERLLNGETQRRFGKAMKTVENECGECRWRRFCSGGCGKYRMDDRFYLCESYKLFFAHADERLRSLTS